MSRSEADGNVPTHATKTPRMPPSTIASTDVMSLEQALAIAGWPDSLLAEEKQAEIVEDIRGFEYELLFGAHVDRIIVLRNGVARLGLDRALPRDLANAANGETCVRKFLARLGDEDTVRELRGRLYCSGPRGRSDEHELKRARDGRELDTLADKRAELAFRDAERETRGDPRELVYLAELRRARKYRHGTDGRWSKTLLSRGVCDWVGRKRVLAMPYWDRYDEGLFVGARYGGSPMHVDQVLWSNVGKSLAGHKLLAIWPYGEPSRDLFAKHNYTLFVPPLSEGEQRAIARASKVALLGPGDVVIFHGGNAHMALSVSESLSVTAYESFVNMNATNIDALLDSGTSSHYEPCRTRQPILDDIKTEVAESLNDLAEDWEDDRLHDVELEQAAPIAIDQLRRDKLIQSKVPELRPHLARRRRLH